MINKLTHVLTLFASFLSIESALMPIYTWASTDEALGGFKFGETYISVVPGKQGMCLMEITIPSKNLSQQLECLAFRSSKAENGVIAYTFYKPSKEDNPTSISFSLYPKEKVGMVRIHMNKTDFDRIVSLDKLECYGDRAFKDIDGRMYAVRFIICRADATDLTIKGTFHLEL